MIQPQTQDLWITWLTITLIGAWPLWVVLRSTNGAFQSTFGIDIAEWFLMKLFPFMDIKRQGEDDIYLRRFFIYPRKPAMNKLERRIYLHKFYKGDEDPHLHDHPWGFTSLILTQGYWEETSDEDADKAGGTNRCYTVGPDWEKRSQKWFGPGSILHRPAAWRHRVVLDNNKPVWSIVRTGVKERSWGFWIEGEQCPWRRYDSQLGVCDDGSPDVQVPSM